MAHNLHLALGLTPLGLGQIMSHISLLTGINYYLFTCKVMNIVKIYANGINLLSKNRTPTIHVPPIRVTREMDDFSQIL
jgi:hypothetical protein